MANDYNSKQNDLISALTNEKKFMDQLIAVYENNNTQSSDLIKTLSETNRRQNFRRESTSLMLPLNSLLSLTFKLEALKKPIKCLRKNVRKHLIARVINSVHLYKMGQKLFVDFKEGPILGQIYMKEVKKNIRNIN